MHVGSNPGWDRKYECNFFCADFFTFFYLNCFSHNLGGVHKPRGLSKERERSFFLVYEGLSLQWLCCYTSWWFSEVVNDIFYKFWGIFFDTEYRLLNYIQNSPTSNQTTEDRDHRGILDRNFTCLHWLVVLSKLWIVIVNKQNF